MRYYSENPFTKGEGDFYRDYFEHCIYLVGFKKYFPGLQPKNTKQGKDGKQPGEFCLRVFSIIRHWVFTREF